jgi:integrase
LDAALAEGFIDRLLPKPKLPRAFRKKPRYFRLPDVAKIVAASKDDRRFFYWLAAQTGLRAGELVALRLADVSPTNVMVHHAAWNGKVSTPKTENSLRTVAVPSHLQTLLTEQVERQRAKGHALLFTSATGTPWTLIYFGKGRCSRYFVRWKSSEPDSTLLGTSTLR